MRFEFYYRIIDWWYYHFRFEVRRTRDSMERRTVLSFTFMRRMPQKHQRKLDQYLRFHLFEAVCHFEMILIP